MRLFSLFNGLILIASLVAMVPTHPAAAEGNEPPVVELVGATSSSTDNATISYILHDQDDGVDGGLTYELYAYPDAALSSAGDIRTFALKIADQHDVTLEAGSGDFTEGDSVDDVQTYTWGAADVSLQAMGFASTQKVLPGSMFIYLLADDAVNEPVYSVSDFVVVFDVNGIDTIERLGVTSVDPKAWGTIKSGDR
jgi:hypothetical protein